MPGIASSAPAVLIGAVAAATERIRVGSGGVMLPNHAPLVVAEQFGTLAALHPGRIDLGLGLSFAFAHHFSATNMVPALARYRECFQPGRALDERYAIVTVQAVCAPTDAEAERIALPAALSFLRLRQGRPGPVPTPDEAARHPWTPMERDFVADRRAGQA